MVILTAITETSGRITGSQSLSGTAHAESNFNLPLDKLQFVVDTVATEPNEAHRQKGTMFTPDFIYWAVYGFHYGWSYLNWVEGFLP